MKNREKYREEIIDLIKLENNVEDGSHSAFCDFVKINVLPNYITKNCADLWCITCNKIFSFWLDEEYEDSQKPEVDWNNVPVDTLVRVRDLNDQDWTLMYFKGLEEEGHINRFQTWVDGATSKTAYGEYENWTFCELVEDEENGN